MAGAKLGERDLTERQDGNARDIRGGKDGNWARCRWVLFLQEILPAPSGVTAVARAEAVVLGITSVRETLLPLLSLRGAYSALPRLRLPMIVKRSLS